MGTSIIGREADLDAIADAIRHARLVTVLGPGGTGKTTIAGAIAERFDAEAHWVELAAVEPGADARAVALRMLGAPDVDTFLAGVDGTPFVVLDNCEHQLDVAASLAAELIAAHPHSKVLATSRIDLGIEGEIRYPIAPLPIRRDDHTSSPSSSPAAELFFARSRELGAAWPDSEANRAAVEAIVGRLDGIPLAIELAAAQSVAVGPERLAPMLDDEPLDVLVDDRGQHRSVRSAVATSVDRLDDDTRSFFESLSVIGFPFDLDLAAAVAGASPTDGLRTCNRLVRESLLTVTHDDDGSSRMRILEPIRALAKERLDEESRRAAERRYIEAIADFADAAVARAITTYDVTTLTEAARRFDHIVRSVELAIQIDDEPDRIFRILIPLLAPACGPRAEIVSLGQRVLDRWPEVADPARAAPPLRAEALAVLAHTAALAADEDHALRMARAAVDDPAATAVARLLGRRAEAMTMAFTDRYDAALAALDHAIDEAASLGGAMVRELRTTRSSLRPYDDDTARELTELANEAAAGDDIIGLTWVFAAIVNGLVLAGRVDEAATWLERAEQRAEVATDRWTTSVLARTRGIVTSAAGEWGPAAAAWRHCVDRHLSHGDYEGVCVALRIAVGGAERCGRADVADRLWGMRPAGRANMAMPMPFEMEEAAVAERNGPALPMALSRAIPLVRELFDEAAVATAPAGAAGDAAVGAGAETRPGTDVIRFADGYELDRGRRELRQDGHVIHVEPQVFDVLSHLASNPGRLVTRDELLDEVWGTRFVTAAAVSSRIRSARAATGDDGRRQAVIRTVHGHGFEFVAAIAG